MYRALLRFLGCVTLAGAMSVGGWWWWHNTEEQRVIAKLRAQQSELEARKSQLEQVVSRLGTDKRVADIIVTDRKQQGSDVKTSLLFVEYDRAGNPMEPRTFEILGQTAHVDAMVIEFKRDQVVANDPLRGHAVALFTRIFGEQQAAGAAPRIDTPGQIPAFYKNADPNTAKFEQRLWNTFWQLEADENLRKEMGVHVAIGKSIWGPFAPDTLYTITLTPDGNLSRTSEPIRGVYQQYIQSLKQKLAVTPAE